MNPPLKIVIVDDHPIVRQGLLKLLRPDPTYQVIRECSDGMEALAAIRSERPDVVILDISLPLIDGLKVVEQIVQDGIQTEFIVLTMYKDEEYFDTALGLGVKGYLLKDNSVNELVKCLQAIASGRYYVCPAFSNFLVNHVARHQRQSKQKQGVDALTPTERSVLKLIAENKTSREIADEMFISHRTVQNHRTHICEKLELRGYHKLLQFALENKSSL